MQVSANLGIVLYLNMYNYNLLDPLEAKMLNNDYMKQREM